jgi:hypothetical protein
MIQSIGGTMVRHSRNYQLAAELKSQSTPMTSYPPADAYKQLMTKLMVDALHARTYGKTPPTS